jgi:hypothetical protein
MTSKVVFSDTRLHRLAEGINSSESISGLHKRLKILVGFSSSEWFGTAFREFISILCCTERNSELWPLPRNGSERNSENLHLFWFHGTEFRAIFSSAEGFGTEFRVFLFRGTTGIPSEVTICSVYSVFRGIIFLSEIPNPTSAEIFLRLVNSSISAEIVRGLTCDDGFRNKNIVSAQKSYFEF